MPLVQYHHPTAPLSSIPIYRQVYVGAQAHYHPCAKELMSLKVFLTSFQSIFAQLGISSTASPPILSKAIPSFNWWVGCHHSEALPNHWLSTEPPKEAHFLDFPKHHQRVKAEEVH